MRRAKWFLIVPLVALVLAVGGSWVYVNVVRDDSPERLGLDATDSEPATDGAAGVEGVWQPTNASQAGYRVKEILFGQDTEAVGRTNAVTGRLEIEGSTVRTASFSVDMATVQSDESRRDNQFRGRIMDVATHPTSTFTLTQPIEIGGLPADGEERPFSAVGDLTLRGTTKPVRFDGTARRNGSTIEVAGSIPVVFAEWNIPNPTFGPARTGDRGELEFRLVFAR